MNKNNFGSVWQMYTEFGLRDSEAGNIGTPTLISSDAFTFRLEALEEELIELEEGYEANDLPKIADSLVDLVIFALGTAVLHNLPWEDLFKEVMRANTDKVPQFTNKKARNGGGSIDLIKPEGWKGPDIEGVLKDYGWDPDAVSSNKND